MPLTGETLCLTTALLWAVSVTMFRGPIVRHGARTINLAKCVIGAALQGATVLALGLGGTVAAASPRDLALLAGSGAIGLVLGDTALFAAVGRLGVHRALLLHTLSPVFAAMLAAAWRHTVPSAVESLGALCVMGGVMLVVAPGRRGAASAAAEPAATGAGVVLGVVAAFGQGSGVVLAKEAMVAVPVVPASFVRLAAAAAGLALVAAARGRLGRLSDLARSRSTATRVVPAALCGTYLALFLMMAGIDRAPAAVAAVLLATPPVFSLGIQALVFGERPGARGYLGTALAVAGVAVLAAG